MPQAADSAQAQTAFWGERGRISCVMKTSLRGVWLLRSAVLTFVLSILPILYHHGSYLLYYGCCWAVFKRLRISTGTTHLEITYASVVSSCQRGVKHILHKLALYPGSLAYIQRSLCAELKTPIHISQLLLYFFIFLASIRQVRFQNVSDTVKNFNNNNKIIVLLEHFVFTQMHLCLFAVILTDLSSKTTNA